MPSIFKLAVSAIAALNQLAVFAAGLLFGGVGALLLGSVIWRRMHATCVQGEVIGVRRNGNCLHAVYRYTSPAGETFEATSTEGSDSPQGKETGRSVALWVLPENPHEAQERGSHFFTVFGVVCLGFGVACFWIGATVWPIGPMTWIVGAVLLTHLLVKLPRAVAPRAGSPPRSGWPAVLALLTALGRKSSGGGSVGSLEMGPVERVEELPALPELRERQIKQRAQLTRYAPIFLLAGVAVLGFGVYQSRALLRLEASGVRTSGLVTSLSSSRSSNGGITYHPLVTYTAGDGRRVVFRDSMGTNPPLYRVGEAVSVLYPPGEPSRAVIDRGVWNWVPSLILYVLGTAACAMAIGAWRARNAGEPFAG